MDWYTPAKELAAANSSIDIASLYPNEWRVPEFRHWVFMHRNRALKNQRWREVCEDILLQGCGAFRSDKEFLEDVSAKSGIDAISELGDEILDAKKVLMNPRISYPCMKTAVAKLAALGVDEFNEDSLSVFFHYLVDESHGSLDINFLDDYPALSQSAAVCGAFRVFCGELAAWSKTVDTLRLTRAWCDFSGDDENAIPGDAKSDKGRKERSRYIAERAIATSFSVPGDLARIIIFPWSRFTRNPSVTQFEKDYPRIQLAESELKYLNRQVQKTNDSDKLAFQQDVSRFVSLCFSHFKHQGETDAGVAYLIGKSALDNGFGDNIRTPTGGNLRAWRKSGKVPAWALKSLTVLMSTQDLKKDLSDSFIKVFFYYWKQIHPEVKTVAAAVQLLPSMSRENIERGLSRD